MQKLDRRRGLGKKGERNTKDVSGAGTLCKFDDHFDVPKLFLASRVQDVHQGVFFIDDTLFPVRIFNYVMR